MRMLTKAFRDLLTLNRGTPLDVATARTLASEARQEASRLATEGAKKKTTDNQHKPPGGKPTEAKAMANAETPQGRPPKDTSLRIYWDALGHTHPGNAGRLETLPQRRERR
jgi:hypothetical protein